MHSVCIYGTRYKQLCMHKQTGHFGEVKRGRLWSMGGLGKYVSKLALNLDHSFLATPRPWLAHHHSCSVSPVSLQLNCQWSKVPSYELMSRGLGNNNKCIKVRLILHQKETESEEWGHGTAWWSIQCDNPQAFCFRFLCFHSGHMWNIHAPLIGRKWGSNFLSLTETSQSV